MSQFTALFIFLDLFAIVGVLNGIFISSLILFIIICKIPSRNSITNLLLANTCVCTLLTCLSYLIIYGYIIANDSTSMAPLTSTYDQQYLCPLRSYFLFSTFSLLYTSYCLQAYYRLRQVVFYRKQYRYRTFICFCVIQWFLSFLLVLPTLFTQSFVYISTEFFCPIPFTKPLSVAYIAITVYGIFLIIYAAIYFWIYIYATPTTVASIQRRRTIDRQFTMLKRMIFPTFSLMFFGIAYLTLFFQTIINQYQTHFLTYRLSYFFVAIGMSFIHIITILQRPTIKNVAMNLFKKIIGKIWRRQENLVNVVHNTNTTVQPQHQRREEPITTVQVRRNKIEPIESISTLTQSIEQKNKTFQTHNRRL